MVRALAEQLAAWADDPAVTRVIVTAAGGRAFSAGGDLRALYDLGRAGRYDEALRFWRDEYRLNAAIKRYRKPYVAIIDGIGDGRRRRDLRSTARIASPATPSASPCPRSGSAFSPMSARPGSCRACRARLGTYCALTGERLDAADAAALGIATHRVASARLPDLVDGAVRRGAGRCAAGRVCGAGRRRARSRLSGRAIDRLFAADRVEDILAALDARALPAGPDADFARARRGHDPHQIAHRASSSRWRSSGAAKSLDFEACMRTEFRIVSRVATGHDFYEGIRAVIVDKDQTPRWRPPSLDAVSDAEVERHFAPIAAELDLS